MSDFVLTYEVALAIMDETLSAKIIKTTFDLMTYNEMSGLMDFKWGLKRTKSDLDTLCSLTVS